MTGAKLLISFRERGGGAGERGHKTINSRYVCEVAVNERKRRTGLGCSISFPVTAQAVTVKWFKGGDFDQREKIPAPDSHQHVNGKNQKLTAQAFKLPNSIKPSRGARRYKEW